MRTCVRVVYIDLFKAQGFVVYVAAANCSTDGHVTTTVFLMFLGSVLAELNLIQHAFFEFIHSALSLNSL